MTISRQYRVIGFALVLCAHMLALFFFGEVYANVPGSTNPVIEFLCLWTVSILLSVYSFRGRGYVKSALFFRFLVLILIGLPFGSDVRIETVLLAAFTFETAMVGKNPQVLFFNSLAILFFVLFQRPFQVGRQAIGTPSIINLFLMLLLPVMTQMASIFIGKLVRNVTNLEDEVKHLNSTVERMINANTNFLQYASRVEKVSVETERKRITRVLHDIIGKTFTNIIAMMDAKLRNVENDDDETVKLHRWIREYTQKGLNQSRAALYQLRGIPCEEAIGLRGLVNIIKTFEQSTSIRVETEYSNIPWEFPPHLDEIIFNVIQESLINAFRHGKATVIRIGFFRDRNRLTFYIRDNGRGSQNAEKGIGQLGMEELVNAVKGNIKFKNGKNEYEVSVELPMEIENHGSY